MGWGCSIKEILTTNRSRLPIGLFQTYYRSESKRTKANNIFIYNMLNLPHNVPELSQTILVGEPDPTFGKVEGRRGTEGLITSFYHEY